MKKLISLLVVGVMWATLGYCADRVIVQYQFKKVLWTCPVCTVEEVEDRPMEGGASYLHTCKNGHKFNQSGPNMKEYNGSINYSKDEYETKKIEDIEAEKTSRMDAWIYEIKHPAPYVEPTKAELQAEYDAKQTELNSLQERINAKTIIAD